MLSLSTRERQIIFFLYSKSPASAKTISSIFNVSEKTIRNDIKSINKICNKTIILSNNKGFSFNKEQENLLANIPLSYKSEEDDKNKILLQLLTNKYVDIYVLADQLNISDSTLINRLNSIKEIITRFDLRLIRLKNKIELKGSSQNMRRFYVNLVLDEVGTTFYDISKFQNYFSNININEVMVVFNNIIKENNLVISDFYLNNLLLNLFTILNFDFPNEEKHVDSHDAIILKISKEINQKLNKFSVDKTENIYLCLVGILKNTNIDNIEVLEKTIKNLCLKTFSKYSLHIDIDSFLHMFSLHVHEMIIRCKHQNPIQSTESLSLKNSCFFIYDIAVSLSNEIASVFHISINENEISLLSMHIGFAIEESLNKDFQSNTFQVLLDSGSYINQDKLIKKITNSVPYNLNIQPYKQSYECEKYDFIISINQKQKYRIDTCYIRPIFTEFDAKHILEFTNKVIREKKKNQFKMLFKLYFNQKNFFVDTEINQRDQVLDFLCRQLENQNIVNSDFKSSVYLREAIDSTNIENKYAIPHAMDFIAKKTVMSVFINPNGIQWNDSNVKIVFLSALSKKNISYLRILYDFIIDMVSEPICFSKLVQATSLENFENILFSE